MNWYVLHTKPRNEKKVAKALSDKGYEVYLPLKKVLKQWSDRKKKVQEPLINSYVFIQTEEVKRQDALFTNGVVRYLHYLGKPAIVRSKEIEAMKCFLGQLEYLPEESFRITDIPKEVTITSGALKNTRGEVISRQGNRLLLQIDSLGCELKVEVPLQHVAC